MSLGGCGARAAWNAYLRDYRRRRKERKAGQSTTPGYYGGPPSSPTPTTAMMSACNEIFGPVHSGHVSWRAGLEAYLELKAIQREA